MSLVNSLRLTGRLTRLVHTKLGGRAPSPILAASQISSSNGSPLTPRSAHTLSFTGMTGPRYGLRSGGPAARSLSTNPDITVQHDEKKKLFITDLGTGKAVLNYRFVSPHVVDLYHTEVPNQLRGRGIGKHLAKAAFDFVKEKDLQMQVSCIYLQKYLKDLDDEQLKERMVYGN